MAAAGRARRRPRRHGRREAARPRPDGRRRRPPARRSGARERGGKEEARWRSSAHPGSTATTETATEAERGGGAARVDEDGGVPAVGGRNEGVDEVDGDAAKPKEAMPKREEDRGDDGGGPKLGGDGGERGRRRELDSDGESERRTAETEEGGTGSDYIVLGVREGGRRGRKPARRSRAPSMTLAKFAGIGAIGSAVAWPPRGAPLLPGPWTRSAVDRPPRVTAMRVPLAGAAPRLDDVSPGIYCAINDLSSLIAFLQCLPCMSLDSGSSDAPVYFEIVVKVPPAAEQGKSCLSLEHVDPILQMLYCKGGRDGAGRALRRPLSLPDSPRHERGLPVALWGRG
uniref:Pr1-like protein n=1 Tax=Oryza sativa subsp. japonica TaxID=39947 RepID=Q8W3A8_ORYSJ|nr:pr1-like protein [Oryza sativa Japonica Group]